MGAASRSGKAGALRMFCTGVTGWHVCDGTVSWMRRTLVKDGREHQEVDVSAKG